MTISEYAIHVNGCPEAGVLTLFIFLVVTNV